MTMVEKVEAVKKAAPGHYISGGDLLAGEFFYGDNSFVDTLIENALFCDMFPEDVPDPNNFFGFCRADYSLGYFE